VLGEHNVVADVGLNDLVLSADKGIPDSSDRGVRANPVLMCAMDGMSGVVRPAALQTARLTAYGSAPRLACSRSISRKTRRSERIGDAGAFCEVWGERSEGHC
jgi:hypothetical protein